MEIWEVSNFYLVNNIAYWIKNIQSNLGHYESESETLKTIGRLLLHFLAERMSHQAASAANKRM